MDEDQKPFTADDIELYVDEEYVPEIHKKLSWRNTNPFGSET